MTFWDTEPWRMSQAVCRLLYKEKCTKGVHLAEGDGNPPPYVCDLRVRDRDLPHRLRLPR